GSKHYFRSASGRWIRIRFPVEGSVIVNEEWVPNSSLQYLSVTEAADGIELKSTEPVTLLLLAGVPFGEKILMWWNFIARTQTEIHEMRDQWNSHLETQEGKARFGVFDDSIGGWIPAPELPNAELRPR
ncbi:MAG: pirin-like C-terminal cupin domain-containing protein, partial [Micrococcales bacterium]